MNTKKKQRKHVVIRFKYSYISLKFIYFGIFEFFKHLGAK